VQEAVSAILLDRAQQTTGMGRLITLSLGAHLALLAGVLVMPAEWRTSRAKAEPSIMTISLGGAAGADTGGMTSIADRAVQAIAKPDAPKAVETPPAAKTPEMVEPDRIAKPTPLHPVRKPDESSKARTPTAGPEIKTGSARVATGGAAVPFGGLASSSKGGGDGVQLDVANFCCPDYIVLMRQRIYQRWNANQGATGEPVIKFTIRRDGMLTQVELEKSSGQALLDLEARRAVLTTMQLPPLPREFTGDHLTVHLTFDFKR
jgi:TonB family protein